MDELIKKILVNISSVLTDTDQSFIENVLKRLVSFGYSLKEDDDDFAISFAIQKVENHIKNFCHVSTIPDGLHPAMVDAICGEFLLMKKQTGQLCITDLDLTNEAVTSIKEGDTTVQFASGDSNGVKLDKFIAYLINSVKGDLVCYRKLKW